MAEAVPNPFGTETPQQADRGGGAEHAGRGGAEEAQRRRCRQAEQGGHFDAQGQRGEQLAPMHRRRARVALRERRRRHRGHRVRDGPFVNAIEFQAMNLVGVDEGGPGGGQADAVAQHARIGARSPARGDVDNGVAVRVPPSGHADGEAVGEERLRRSHRGCGDVLEAGLR